MSADRIFCYAPHRAAVVAFMHEIGGLVSPHSPHPIDDEMSLMGREHVTFIVIDNHSKKIPQRIWDRIIEIGAVVIHVDDQFARSHRLTVRAHGSPHASV